MQEAAARLGLGITTLKRACRVNGMMRWPYRKRNSLGRLIDRTQQVLDDGTGQDNMQKLAALQVLEKQRQILRVSLACPVPCDRVWIGLPLQACTWRARTSGVGILGACVAVCLLTCDCDCDACKPVAHPLSPLALKGQGCSCVLTAVQMGFQSRSIKV